MYSRLLFTYLVMQALSSRHLVSSAPTGNVTVATSSETNVAAGAEGHQQLESTKATSTSYQVTMMFLRIWPFLGAPLILLGVLVWRFVNRPRHVHTDAIRHTTLGG